MYALLFSAFNGALGFALRSVVVKLVVFFALYFITVEFIPLLAALLPTAANLNSAFAGIPAGVWYFLDLFAFTQGLPIVLSAVVTRFIIRRLPIIG